MRKKVRDTLVGIAETVLECVDDAKKPKKKAQSPQLMADAHVGISVIGEHLTTLLSPERGEEYKVLLEEAIAQLDTMKTMLAQDEKVSQVAKEIEINVQQLIKELNQESEVTYEVVFFPYKLSMWDSFESIWKEAKQDPRCRCYVVPIPYYERNPNGSFKEIIYEGDRYPEEVEAIDYRSYDLEQHMPDVIYYHNPYDENNYVTSVHPDYYSSRLKNYTDMLVYVPYSVPRTIYKKEDFNLYSMVEQHADKIVCQNEVEVEARCTKKTMRRKYLPVGNPKLDVAFSIMENPPELPLSWKEKIKGRKVILLNLSIDYVLNHNMNYIYMVAKEVLSFQYGKENEKQEDVVLLFRPHPLLESTFRSMRPGMYEQYQSFLKSIETSENGLIDKEEKPDAGFYYSDALMSTSSSLVCNYMLTEKPIFLMMINPYGYDLMKKIYSQDLVHIYDLSWCWYSAAESEVVTFRQKAWGREVRNLHQSSSPKTSLLPIEEKKFGIRTLLPREFIRYVAREADAIQTSNGSCQKIVRMDKFREAAVNCEGKNGANVHHEIMGIISGKKR